MGHFLRSAARRGSCAQARRMASIRRAPARTGCSDVSLVRVAGAVTQAWTTAIGHGTMVQQGHDRTGLGLGLSICMKAVKSMGGELRVRDLPGKGCVFKIDLPRQLIPPGYIFPRQTSSSKEPEN